MDNHKTPLHNEHLNLKALVAPFAGWEMPIHYGSIIEEAKYTRSHVSIFDISHMGEFLIQENPDRSSLDAAITVPVSSMKQGSCKYGFLLSEQGTILDDLIVYRLKTDTWMIVVNASGEEEDENILRQRLSKNASMENISKKTSKIDIQGPDSLELINNLFDHIVKNLSYYTFNTFNFLGDDHIISRTGYTGEYGFEIYIDESKVVELWQLLLAQEKLKPAGLGARDILRLEMGYPLYGNELTVNTTPLDTGMGRFLDLNKDFIGRESLIRQKDQGLSKGIISFTIDGRRTPRHENRILIDGKDSGFVTSGVFSPHLNKGIGMGYCSINEIMGKKKIMIDTGRGEITGLITQPPFIKNTSLKWNNLPPLDTDKNI